MTEHKIKWSHSSLKDYEGCARRYHEVKVLNKYPFQETEQIRYGKELHKAAEDYVKDGTPIPKQFEFVTPVIDALMAKPGRKFPEHEMGLTIDLKPCNFKDGDVWVRGIADLLIVDDDNLRCQSSLRLLSTTLGTLRKAHCATGAQYAHANFTQNTRSKSWHVITKKNTSAT
jgi:hypothetical protein